MDYGACIRTQFLINSIAHVCFLCSALYEEKRSEKAVFIFSLLKTATEKQMC